MFLRNNGQFFIRLQKEPPMTHLMYKQFFTKYGLKDETFLCITSNSVVAAVFFSLKYFGQISLKHFGHFSLRHFGQ